ncbi:MAG: cell division protein ZapB [Bryobacteraceae bacterium]|jgi:FtsZ-binding cell division protein ZapB
MTPGEQEIDALASLEERINRAVEAVNYLRKEKEVIAQQLETVMSERDAARKEAALAQAQAQKVAQELDDLRSERKQVRTRIEKLLGQMDLLNVT